MSKETKDRIVRIAIIVGAIAFTAILIYYRDQIKRFGSLGYPGIFLIAMLSSATVFVPLPGIMFTTAMGAVFNPLWVAFAAGTGAGLGEISGYMVGFTGRDLVNKTAWHERVEGWIKKFGILVIIVLASIPNPAFDFVGFTAGVLKLPLWQFVTGAVIGNIIKMLFFAYGGAGVFSMIPIGR
jgi:uncharacterized membrane protein YdjX (TVP38/TMEM64 family)